MKVSNKNARRYVEQQKVFTGSNCFSEQRGRMYVVFSYGHHWPMFIFREGKWYENGSKYSVTTSKQHSQLRPSAEMEVLSHQEMLRML